QLQSLETSEALQLQSLETSDAPQLQSLGTSEAESVSEAEHVQSLDYQNNLILLLKTSSQSIRSLFPS
ncbi:hypothetical protein A2U01_0109643, partial [Trifolium medium]|nr:hypothetical protein [Trifolium medium]